MTIHSQSPLAPLRPRGHPALSILDLRWMFVLSLVSFTIGTVVGLLVPYGAHLSVSELEPEVVSSTAATIASNNATVAGTMLLVGLVTASMGAHALLFLNGLLIGKLLGALLESGDLQVLIVGLLPHGIVEIVGLALIAAATATPVRLLIDRFIRHEVHAEWRKLLQAIVAIAAGLILLVAAALIEDYLSHVSFGV